MPLKTYLIPTFRELGYILRLIYKITIQSADTLLSKVNLKKKENTTYQ